MKLTSSSSFALYYSTRANSVQFGNAHRASKLIVDVLNANNLVRIRL